MIFFNFCFEWDKIFILMTGKINLIFFTPCFSKTIYDFRNSFLNKNSQFYIKIHIQKKNSYDFPLFLIFERAKIFILLIEKVHSTL